MQGGKRSQERDMEGIRGLFSHSLEAGGCMNNRRSPSGCQWLLGVALMRTLEKVLDRKIIAQKLEIENKG